MKVPKSLGMEDSQTQSSESDSLFFNFKHRLSFMDFVVQLPQEKSGM